MSFSKASIKRFNENAGCAPPVGSYDPKLKDKTVALPFDKGGDRFKAPKDVVPGPGAFDVDTPAKKQLFNASTCSNGGEKKKLHKSSESSADMAKIKDLEKEIKKLVQERTNQDKQLTQREDEMVKLEGRLQLAHTDKLSLQARIASLEKELKEVKKSNEVLKNKMATADAASKKQENLQVELSSLKTQMECKTKEIAKLKQELESIQNHQTSDLQIFESIVISLEEKVEQFDFCKENEGQIKNVKTSSINANDSKRKGSEDRSVSIKTDTCRESAEKLQKRFNQVIQKYENKLQQYKTNMENRYDKVVEDKQTLEQNLQHAEKELEGLREKSDVLEKNSGTLSKQYSTLRRMVQQLRSETWNNEDNIRFLKGEIFSKENSLKEEGQILFEVKAEKASLLETLEVLEEENATLNENIKTLTEKYHVIESRLADEQNQNNLKSDQVQSQLDVTKCQLMKVQDEYQALQTKNKELVHSVNKEKECVEKLIYQMEEQKQLSCDLQNLVTDKDNKITDLEISLEATKVELQNVMETIDSKEADIIELKDRIQNLETVEKSLQGQIEKENEEHLRTVRLHADRILELEQLEISVTEENVRLCKKLEESNEKISASEGKLDNASKEIEILKDESKMKVESLANQLKLVLEEKDNLKKNIETAQVESNDLKKEVLALKDRLKLKENELEAEKQSQIEISQEMTGNIQHLYQEKQNLVRNIESLSSELDSVKESNVKLLEQIQELDKVKEGKKQSDDKIKKLELKFRSLNTENNHLMNEIEFLQQSKEREQHDLREKLEEMENDLANLKKKEKQQNEIISGHLKSIEEARSREDKLGQENLSLTSKLQDVSNEREAISKQFLELIGSLEEVRNHSAKRESEENLRKMLEESKEREGQLLQEIQSLQSAYNSKEEEKEQMARQYEDELTDLRDKARDMGDTNWKKLYEDLMTKVEPFMEQLDAFELEKTALLGRSQFAQAEMDKLSNAYAKLLGHQNQKQKIHHIIKIKEENNNLKKEVSTLREQVSKLKRSNQKMEEKMSSVEGKRKFDPAKAFQHKENTAPPSSPLKDGNRKFSESLVGSKSDGI